MVFTKIIYNDYTDDTTANVVTYWCS